MIEDNSYLKGDINEDGKISAMDYVLIRKHLLGTSILNDKKRKRADANGDGKVNEGDYVFMRIALLSSTK